MIARIANIRRLQQFEQFPARKPFVFCFGYLFIVRIAGGERLLKDRRVRRHAGEGVIANAAVELAILEYSAVDAVEPDRLPDVVKILQCVLGH